MRKLSPIGWAVQPLKKYGNFSGRASRAEFWWFFLFLMLVYLVFWTALIAIVGTTASMGNQPQFAMLGAFGFFGILMLLAYLALLIPMIAVQVRRLHDINRSGWWLGGFWLLYVAYMVLLFGAGMSVQPGAAVPSYSIFLGLVSGIFALGFFSIRSCSLSSGVFRAPPGANRFGEDPHGADVEQVFA